jgi:hypothetical protein
MGGLSVRTDPRREVRLGFGANWNVQDGTGTRRLSLSPSATVRPSHWMDVSLRPSVSWNRATWQYVGRRTDANAGGIDRYVVGHLDQATASLTARVDLSFTPELSLQLYASPFVSAGDYTGFREVADPRARRFDSRFRPLAEELRECVDASGGVFYGVRGAREGCAAGEGGAGFAYRFGNPDFNLREFRSNAVLRWEYRPGSTLFVVWSNGRSSFAPDGRMDAWEDTAELFRAPGTNVLLVKLSYWLGI